MAVGASVNVPRMPTFNIPVAFRIFQTRISFKVFDMLLLTIVLSGSVASIASRDRAQESALEILGAGLIVSACGIVLVVLHGLVRMLAYRWCGVPMFGISIDYAGDDPDVSRERSSPLIELCVGLVGIAVSLIHAAALLAIHEYWAVNQSKPLLEASTLTLALFMIALAVLQLMPGISQDGGQIVRGLIWRRTGSPMRGAWVTGRIGQSASAVVVLGLGLVFARSFSIVLGLAIIVLAVHLGLLARYGAHTVGWQYVHVSDEIELRDVLKGPAHLIPADDTVAERIRMVMQDPSAAFLVIDPQGTACGVISARNLNPIVMIAKRKSKIADVMTPLHRVRSFTSDWPASSAWEMLRQAGENAIVITDDGIPTDTITHDQLRRHLVVLSHRFATS